MTAPDLAARADRVHALVEGYFGKVLDRQGTVMIVEIPADIAPGMPWGMGGFVPQYLSQHTGVANRRVVSMNGTYVVCENDPVTQAYFRYEIDLCPDPPASRRRRRRRKTSRGQRNHTDKGSKPCYISREGICHEHTPRPRCR
jgi:hypothetical protein